MNSVLPAERPEQALIYKVLDNFSQKHNFIHNFYLRIPDYRQFRDFLNSEFGITKIGDRYVEYHNPNIPLSIFLSANITLNEVDIVIGTDKAEQLDIFYSKCVELFHSREDNFSISAVSGTRQNINFQEINLPPTNSTYILKDLYPDIDIDCLVKDYDEASDKILILYGPPGTGKSSFLKYYITNSNLIKRFRSTNPYNSSVFYSKDPDITSSNNFWMMSLNVPVVILDDLDIDFSARDLSNDFVTNLLSISDGIFGSAAPKVIITTNQPISKIDEAIIRPGRCFDFIQLSPMSYEYAIEIWKQLGHSEQLFTDYFGFHRKKEIYQSSFYNLYKNCSSKETTRTYVKDISNRNYDIYERLRQINVSVSSDKKAKLL